MSSMSSMSSMTPDAVATMEGRELDAALHGRLFGREVRHVQGDDWRTRVDVKNDKWEGEVEDQVPHYSTDPAAFFAMVEKVRANGWMFIDMHVGFYDTETVWTVCITCGRGPCELHGNKEDDAHSVEARWHTLPLAFARAALLTCLNTNGATS